MKKNLLARRIMSVSLALLLTMALIPSGAFAVEGTEDSAAKTLGGGGL